MIHNLTRSHQARGGAPTVERVDDAIFVRRYFTHCMSCAFCKDSCCNYGVDVDTVTVDRILAHADAIESAVGVSRDMWFEGGSQPAFREDVEHPGGRFTRTRVIDGRCVFRRGVRGCALHAWADSAGVDYHEVKPMVSVLFPITFDEGLLHPSTEIHDGSLVCANAGPTLYRGVRDEIAHYFSEALVTELDAMESVVS